jgi:cell division protease FtsH
MIVYGDLSTGSNNDLVGNTELARKMVREWGMSDRVGPMAWGSQGAVFLGDDLMHTRDYSDETSRVIDEEVGRILREQEQRATEFLERHKGGLDSVAGALLEKETIDGDEVARLVDDAFGAPVRDVSTPKLVSQPAATPEPEREREPEPEPEVADEPDDDDVAAAPRRRARG